MSQLDYQQIDAPFRQSLIRPAVPNRGRAGGGGGSMPQMGWIGDQGNYDNDAMRLQNAQNLAVARRQQGQGQATSSERYMSGGPSPIQKAIVASKQAMLAQSLSGNETDEEKSQLGELAGNPNLPLNEFQRVLSAKPRKTAPAQQPHNWGGQQPQQSDETVDVPKGAFAGQQMQRGDILMNGSKGMTASLGFTEPQQGGGEDSVVNMVNAFKGKVPNEVLTGVQQAINSGMNPQQAFAHLQQAAQQQGAGQQREEAGQQRQQMTQQRQKLSVLTHQQNQLHQDVTKMHSQLTQYGINPDGPESDAQQAGPEALAMYRAYHQKGQLYQNLQQQIEGGIQNMGGQQEQQPQGGQADLRNLPADYQMNGSAQAPATGHVPHAQFGPDGQVVQGSRGPISPDIAAHYIRRTGSKEAGMAAAQAEGWQL